MKPAKVTIHSGPMHPQPTRNASASGCGSAFTLRFVFRTANENGGEMRLTAGICTANIATIGDGDWALIAPYGRHPAPDGSYVQHFDRPQAEKVVATWNSITGKAARVFKNLWHGLGAKFSVPVWDGHPETDKQRWPRERLLAEITDLRTTHAGLEGRVQWTSNSQAARTRGPLFPSALWWHWPPSGEPPAVYPELLESIGLVPTPNIPAVPAWTANALPGLPPDENQNENMNYRDQLIALLGLKADATDAAIQSSLDAHAAKVNSTANALSTANAEKAQLEKQLTTANGQVQTLTTNLDNLVAERDGLKTANGALTAERDGLIAQQGVLVTGVLNIAEKRGAITPAEHETFKTRITTANTAAATLAELQSRKAMHTQSVEINGNRIDLSTANARSDALQSAIAKRMKQDGLEYDAAYQAVKADPQFAGLFAAMSDPTRQQS